MHQDESTSEFTDSVERYDPGPPPDATASAGGGPPLREDEQHVLGPESKWVVCEGMGMPTALHAHTSHGLPVL